MTQITLKHLKFSKNDKISCKFNLIDNHSEFDCQYIPKESGWGFKGDNMNLGKFNYISGVGKMKAGWNNVVQFSFPNDTICKIQWNEAGRYGSPADPVLRSRHESPEGFELDCPTTTVSVSESLVSSGLKGSLRRKILSNTREIIQNTPLEPIVNIN